MNIFRNVYTRVLHEESVSLTEFTSWNPGINTLFYKQPSDPLQPTQRHRKIIKDPGFRKYAQTVPTMHKVDPTAIHAVQKLKKANSGREVLSQDELQKVCKQFGISRINPNKSKMLGNTSIILKFDPVARAYILQK